ncbi:hypothetical protein BLA60_23315 [Actinophytocola xinjiangensis]|uniref:Uncharacterized protein n=1 Tax=Actinophytocola xinjiangensis TaxID=485602 RepID=A0A7Z0WMD0_9PSEU|nr:response regulator transcription factor [Actinophytocola xinjiangensis]OLF08357.1 hypothetical protein BLA60_23315 [Actinophytocola xinjiangensis]
MAHDPATAGSVMTYLAWPLTTPWPASRHRYWLRRATALLPQGASVRRQSRTIATQLSSAMRKLGVPSRTALAVTVLRDGRHLAGADWSVRACT